MNIRDLRYLLALAELGNFGRASERCFVSQPTLSMQIKKLEEELGVVLFERDKKFVRITAAGDTVVQYAQQIVQLVDDMKQAAPAMANPYAGTLKLGIFPTLAPYILPKIVKKIKSKLPDLSLKLYEQITAECIENLTNGSLDAILIATELAESRFNHLDLFCENFYLVCPQDHALTKFKTVTANRLPEHELLLLAEGHCLRNQSLEYCQRIGKEHNTDFSATSLSTIVAMVGLGKGITLAPALSLAGIKHQPVVIRAFNTDSPSRKVSVYWRKSMAGKELLYKLADIIKQALKNVEGVRIK